MEDLTNIPYSYKKTLDLDMTQDEIDELVADLIAEGASGSDPVETIKGCVRYLRKKWDELND